MNHQSFFQYVEKYFFLKSSPSAVQPTAADHVSTIVIKLLIFIVHNLNNFSRLETTFLVKNCFLFFFILTHFDSFLQLHRRACLKTFSLQRFYWTQDNFGIIIMHWQWVQRLLIASWIHYKSSIDPFESLIYKLKQIIRGPQKQKNKTGVEETRRSGNAERVE